MAKTVVEKIASPSSDVSFFKISGVLGYHENSVLERFFAECSKKAITKLILDFTELGSLGGGCAGIIREAANGGEIAVCIVGASQTVQRFLEKKGQTKIIYVSEQAAALDALAGATDEKPKAKRSTPPAKEKVTAEKQSAASTQRSTGRQRPERSAKQDAPAEAPQVAVALDDEEKPVAETRKPEAKPVTEGELQDRLSQYRSLFSLSSDLSQIRNKKQVIEAFLLTMIGQTGTETAAFFERSGEQFRMTGWKGFETADPSKFTFDSGEIDESRWLTSTRVCETEEAPLTIETRKKILDWGMPFAAPFIIHGEIQGVVLLGGSTRGDFEDATFDFMTMLINQVAIAYENSRRFEQENQRTLGVVQSLISMIDDHTLFRGNSETVLAYVHAVAREMQYPEENIKELIYGAVLRDIGMIKVSDMIVQSERELKEEEWNIIKRHPIEGCDMLRNMSFSDHTCQVVLCHHERFNGRGYPRGIQGTQIPLGARIVSVVESYAVMLQDRPTRPAVTSEKALSTLKENWGKRYDPDVVAAFAEMLEEEIRTGQEVKYDSSELFGDRGKQNGR